jgi:tRNA (cmo5U34)-methyltransferase
MAKDTVYKARSPDQPFRFNAEVAAVFPDMLRRSIPGYEASLEAIGSLAMRQGIRAAGCRIVAVDNAPAMIERCRSIVRDECRRQPDGAAIELVEGDILDTGISNASMVVLNYTLQFLPLADRDTMIGRIAAGLNDGGLLVLSEKVVDPDPAMEALLVDLHHEHKRRNDYSALEISRKRAALENVLIPESVDQHRDRLLRAGFSSAAVWLRYFNFVSIIAIR